MNNMEDLTNEQLIQQIDYIEEWARTAHPSCKNELYEKRKEYIAELESRYIDKGLMDLLKK